MKKRLGLIALAGVMLLGLPGCSMLNEDNAWRLAEQQQEKYALEQQHDAQEVRRNAAKKPELMLSMIREMQQQKRYFASLAYIDAYRQQFGEQGDVMALRADALRMTGQTQDSEQAYRALLKTEYAASGWHGLGLLAGAAGDYAQAEQNMEQAVRLAPTQADILNDLAYTRLQQGKTTQARLPLGQAVELDPENQTIISNLALLLLLQGDAVGAEHIMDQAGLETIARQQIQRLAMEVRLRQQAAAVPAAAPVAGNVTAPAVAAPVASQLPLPNMSPVQGRVTESFINPVAARR